MNNAKLRVWFMTLCFTAVAMLAFPVLAQAAPTEIACPASMQVTATVEAPAGWEVIPPSNEPQLEGITVYFDHPTRIMSQAPDELPAKDGFEIMRWGIDPKSSQYWLECRYNGTASTLAQRLPSGLSTCFAYYEKIAYGLGPFKRFECE